MSEHRLIDADLLASSFRSAAERVKSENEGSTMYSLTLHNIGEMLASGELGITVDAVLVVRCKDCRHADQSTGYEGLKCVWCNERQTCEREDGFCYMGEKR